MVCQFFLSANISLQFKKNPYHSIFPEVLIKILVYSFVVVISHDTMKNLVKSSLRKSSSFPLKVFADWNDVWRNSQSEVVNSTRFNILHSEELTDQITITMISYRIVIIGKCLSINIFISGYPKVKTKQFHDT